MAFTDIRKKGWIESLPEKARPYLYLMRLDRPVGWLLLLFPGWWAIVLGGGGLAGISAHMLTLLTLFLAGAVLMRGAGCVINDLWDRELDQKVERTQDRPLAAGKIAPLDAFLFLGALLILSGLILFALPLPAILLGLASLPLIVIYPLMKRVTFWPQAVLGLTFNFGALIGWAATLASWPPAAAWALYAGAFFWTMGYDTIYAHQDRQDDILAGVKSTALKFGATSKKWVAGFYATAWLFMTLALWLETYSLPGIALMILPGLHLARQLGGWDMQDKQSSLDVFRSNMKFGLLLLAVCALSPLLP